MQSHHMQKLDTPGRAHGRSREPHVACFCRSHQCPRLGVGNGEKMFSVSLRGGGAVRRANLEKYLEQEKNREVQLGYPP